MLLLQQYTVLLLDMNRTIVFSSEGRTIKPSHTLCQRALADLPPGATVLFAGDSLDRDIIPAKALGMDTAWIAPAGSSHPAADIVIEGLPDLAVAPAISKSQCQDCWT
jgi:putative hydrolase of the HAD superfamily